MPGEQAGDHAVQHIPANGASSRSRSSYTGRPGRAHRRRRHDRGLVPQRHPAGDGGFVTTEPVGTEDWMPLNNHPSAKPTYDFYDTVTAGRTAVANGMLRLRRCTTRPTRTSPSGSTTWHWHSPRPDRELPGREQRRQLRPDLRATPTTASATTRRRPASIEPAQKQANLAIMDQQQDITDFQSQFNGPFPFTSDGVLVGIPEAELRGGDADDDHLPGRPDRPATRSTTRTCTSGGATASPRATTT